MGGPSIRVLSTAFAAVPGSSAHAAAMLAMVDGLRGELDMVTVKTPDLAHIKRIGDARMFRVPVGRATVDEQRATYARAVSRQLASEPYDVVHVLDPWSGAAAAERKGEQGFQLVYEIVTFPDHDPEAARRGEAERLWLEGHTATLAAADRVLVATNAAARALKTQGHTGPVDVVRPGVDVGTFDKREALVTATPRVLYLGSFSELRDVGTMVEALGKVAAHRPIRALLAGERIAERRNALRARVDDLGLSPVIDVRGEPNPRTLSALIGAADVCVVPARAHPVAELTELPQPLLEHCACHRPVVASNVSGVSEVVRDDVEGLLFPAEDAGAMADAILEVLRDSVLRDRITGAGFRRVRDELNAGARRRRLRTIYDQLVPGSQQVDPWAERFEEVAGLVELSTSSLEALAEEVEAEQSSTTDETESPAEHPRVATQPVARSTDTQPGLIVPDTDPRSR